MFIRIVIEAVTHLLIITRRPVYIGVDNTTDVDFKWNLLVQLPGIGSAGADKIIESGMSIKELSEMSAEELRKKFKNIGKKRASRILKILNI